MKQTCSPEKPVKGGNRLAPTIEKSNFVTAHMRIVDYLCAILDDCRTIIPSYTCVECDLDKKTVQTRMVHEGLSFATKALPSFFDGILNHLETGVSFYPSFKTDGRGYPVFLRQLTSLIFEPVCDDSKVKAFECVYQLCASFKRLEGPYSQRVILNQLKDFIEVDKGLSESYPRVFQQKIIGIARGLIGRVLDGLNPFDRDQAELFIPRPGPGATNTPTEKHERFRPHVFYTQLADFPLKEWYTTPNGLHPQTSRWDLRVGRTILPDVKTSGKLTSRFKFVPKTYSKARGICIEELEMQWLQQGIRNALYDRIEHHPLTKGYVNFTDQTINGDIALTSSLTREYATIDMSAASDRVSRVLVNELFSSNEHMLKALNVLSTRIIRLPNASPIKNLSANKFAPMGSALCFPVMGLSLWALIKSLMLFFRVPRKDSMVYVYGDDIIVKSKYARFVFDFLPLFDMKINKSKSFVKSHFRESCGTHAYMGVDITPTRFKTIVKFPPCNEDLISNLQYEGALFKRGFKNVASIIRRDILHLKQFGAEKFPKVTEKSPLLGWIREECDAFELLGSKERWNPEHTMKQRSVLVLAPIKAKVSPFVSEVECYLHWLIRHPTDARYMGEPPIGLQVRRRWVAGSDILPVHPVKDLILRMFRLER